MGIAGVGSYSYANYYQTNVTRKCNQTSSAVSARASSNITLHMTDGETDNKSLTSVGFPNGTSASVFKADNYSEENPQYLVKYWDENGEIQEYNVNPREVDPSNASYIEMLAYSTYSDVQGYTTNAFGDFLSAAGGVNADLTYDSSNINEKRDFKSKVQEFMQMQYDAGNISGYASYKQLYDYMDSADSKEDYSKVLEQYSEKIKEKIKNGETEETFQIGGQSFTEEEWKKLIEKIDKDIEQIQKEQAERLEKEKAEQTSTDSVSKANSDVTEIQVQELLKDNNERRFETYGPNAPEEVKQAWMKAAEETGINGLGMQSSGMMGHITQLDVQRAIQWYNGENPDVLGTTVESARQAVEQALYDLEHPLEPITNKSADVQKSIEQEKIFYKAFLEKLQSGVTTTENATTFDRTEMAAKAEEIPSFVGKVYTKEELFQDVDKQIQQNAGNKKTLEDMIKDSCDDWETASFGFVGESKIYNFYEFVQELKKRSENIV